MQKPANVVETKNNKKKDDNNKLFPIVGIGDSAGGLEALEGFFVNMLPQSTLAITVCNLDVRITAWNRGAEEMYGYSEDEALKMNISMMLPEDKMNKNLKILKDIKAGKKVGSFFTQRLTKKKEVKDVWLKVTRLLDEKSKITAFVSTERDLSELEQLKEKPGSMRYI